MTGDADRLMNELAGHALSKADARELADAEGEGKTLVAAQVLDAEAEKAASIMGRYESSQEGGNGEESGRTVPIVEEELSVAKGRVANGGVRVSSSVSETPVEKKVTLRGEHVEASAGRPTASSAPLSREPRSKRRRLK